MKIVEDAHARLVIQDRPWFIWITCTPMGIAAIWAALMGRLAGWGETLLVLAVGIGLLGMIWKYCPAQRIVFDRTRGTFTHQVHRLTGSQTWERPLEDVEKAIDGPYHVSGDSLNRLVLQMKDGRYPLESGYTGLSRERVTNRINAWLRE